MVTQNKLPQLKGRLVVIIGCMYAGKTEAFISRVHRLQYANYQVQVFKPRFDRRYSQDHVVSHSQLTIKCEVVADSQTLLKKVHRNVDVIAIDELQFFDDGIAEVINELANNNYVVIANGLDKDYRGQIFPHVLRAIGYAERVIKLNAICLMCGADADRTQRLRGGRPVSDQEPVIIDQNKENITYEARCRHHHIVIHSEDLSVNA